MKQDEKLIGGIHEVIHVYYLSSKPEFCFNAIFKMTIYDKYTLCNSCLKSLSLKWQTCIETREATSL